MPLSIASMNAVSSFTLAKANSGFAPTTSGPNSIAFSLPSLNLTYYNQAYSVQLSLAASASSTINLQSVTNLIGENVVFAHVLSIFVTAATSEFTISPGAMNGLNWYLSIYGSAGVVIPAGGFFAFSSPATSLGTVVDSSHKNLAVQNTGAVTGICSLVIFGAT